MARAVAPGAWGPDDVGMNPEEYEHHVADVLRSEGWTTTVTRQARDLGVDVFAVSGERRLAIQAKMYGSSSTKVNAEQIMCLHGASAYADCNESMLATDGQLTHEAELVADKLGIAVRHIGVPTAWLAEDLPPGTRSFGAIWRDYIEPLAGTELVRESGKTMKIVEVDGSGIRRITTGGTAQRISIDIFRWTIERLLAGETVSRKEIHERNPRKVSSGVMLILGSVPGFETVSIDQGKALRSRATAT